MTDWKRKLAAYLHDPPSKVVSIADHERHAETLYRQAGFDAEETARFGQLFAKPSDWAASSADRLPFPQSQAAALQCAFDGVRNTFLHPLGPGLGSNEPLRLPFTGPFLSTDAARETDQVIQPCLPPEQLAHLSLDEAWKTRFFVHWRFWRRNAVGRDYRFALLPADTRLPEHSVWTHMQMVSALDTCAEGVGKEAVLKPAFLKLQLGPVQDFIAAARSTRDLWSGSYLLSWLMAAGLKALSSEVGPDAVIYPSLRDQPLFDLHWRADLWSWVRLGDRTAWESLGYKPDEPGLLTPNLPNVLLAVVPAHRASELGHLIERTIREEWERIAEAVWQQCEQAGVMEDEPGITKSRRRIRFASQVARFLSLSWQATLWPDTLHAALKMAGGFAPKMPISLAAEGLRQIVRLAEHSMPFDHRDRRYYTDDSKQRLNNIGLGWSVILLLNSWQLDAVRQARPFDAWTAGGWHNGTFSNKDSLTGKEEAVAGGRGWQDRCKQLGGSWRVLFKKEDWLGASTLVKRVWHLAYLAQGPWALRTGPEHFPMPNTRGIAAHTPFSEYEDEDVEAAPDSEKYFAVLAFDGDEIGKWMSGEKMPRFATQLADYADAQGAVPQGSKAYFANPANGQTALLEARRPLSPSYHLQFSEALGNFALLCVRPIVEAFDGRLIYAGGDDVVALLPADTALDCAQALRMTFRGATELASFLGRHAETLRARHLAAGSRIAYHQRLAAENLLIAGSAPGFLARQDCVDSLNERPIPFIVPGPAADCSVGIAIAHFKSPLQDVVRAAQDAEKRAKKGLGRSAVAVTLMKRSGELLEWGCRWDSGGLELLEKVQDAIAKEHLSGKFPHRVCEFLEPYLTATSPMTREAESTQAMPEFEIAKIIGLDFDHAVSQQSPLNGEEKKRLRAQLAPLLDHYLSSLADRCSKELEGFEERFAKGKARSWERPRRTDLFCGSVIGLMQTVAFAHRTDPGKTL